MKIAKDGALPLLCYVMTCVAPWMLSAQELGAQPLVWQPLPNSQCDGLLTERVNLWRDDRLWYMLTAEDDYLLSGFEDRPGIHGWQGEHVGKWLHAATLAYEQTGDEKLLEALNDVANRLVATQEADGYMGTYRANYRFTAKPENGVDSDIADDLEPVKKGERHGGAGWDTWTFRYNLYGLLTYEKFHKNPKVVDACRRMADLLIATYGEGRYDLTKYGTRRGISATTLLESIMMLYARTHEEKYLNFAEHIVGLQENKEDLRIMGNMLERGSVTKSGEGKAYQFLANLLGYVLLYQYTGEEKYLQTAVIGWEEVLDKHIDVAGGPWGRRAPYNGHRECFAKPQDYDPDVADIETCSTTTWVQLCLHLFELTGRARYSLEAERSMFNALMAAQYPEGVDWSYYLKANQRRRPYATKITCCSSSGPRALEMFNYYLVGRVDDGIAFGSLVPCGIELPESMGSAKIQVTGNYPVDSEATIVFKEAAGSAFRLEFRVPYGASLKSVSLNGDAITADINERGHYRLDRAWKTGDQLAIDFDYQLQAHVVTPRADAEWIAYTYGPWALSQVVVNDGQKNPDFAIGQYRDVQPSEYLELLPNKSSMGPVFRVVGSDVVLSPYYLAGTKKTGPRTYFKVSK